MNTLFIRSHSFQWFAAILAGCLLALSFPKFSWSFLAWVALAPLLFVLGQAQLSRIKAFGLGGATGWIFFFFSANWITHSMTQYGGLNVGLAYAAAACFTALTALFPGLFALTVRELVQRLGFWALGFAPLVWVATEWLRGVVTGVTWNELGISQVDQGRIARFAQIGGAELISAGVVASSVVLVLLLRFQAPKVRQVLGVFVIFAAALYLTDLMQVPAVSVQPVSSREVQVAGIQPNIPVDILTDSDAILQRNSAGIAAAEKLTRTVIDETERKKVDIIVWAESPLILNYEQDDAVRARLNALAQEQRAHVITSAFARDGERAYNSTQTITPDGRALQRYDKIRLVPFGEYVPLRPLLGYFVPAMVGDFTPGTNAVVNVLKLSPQQALIQNEKDTQGEIALERTTKFTRVGTFICYEAAAPNLVRKFVLNGAAFLVNVSDDAWFGLSAGPAQHLNHARMRAIENNRDIVRVTNSGISALITNEGKIVDALPSFTAAGKVWNVQEQRNLTLYTKYGDWFAYVSLVIIAVAILVSWKKQPEKTVA